MIIFLILYNKMASNLLGFVLGLYTGAMIREEYYFPTSEKIAEAVRIFKKNEEIIEAAAKESKENSNEKNPSKI